MTDTFIAPENGRILGIIDLPTGVEVTICHNNRELFSGPYPVLPEPWDFPFAREDVLTLAMPVKYCAAVLAVALQGDS